MPLTLAEVEEALAHATRVPIEDRGPAWWAFVDGLLEQRKELASKAMIPEQHRVMFSSETR